jgi:hypothetical protein
MSTDSRAFAPNVVLGLAISAVGVVLILDRLGLADARAALQYWPLLLVLFGGSIVWQAIHGPVDGAERGSHALVSPGLVVLLVIVGVIAARADFRRPNQSGSSASERLSVSAVLGSSRQVSTAPSFRGADMTSIMGGSTLDLRNTMIADGGEAVIEVFALMGAVDLFVPSHWVVVSEVVPVLGGLDGRRTRGRTRAAGDAETEAKVEAGAGAPAPVEALEPVTAPGSAASGTPTGNPPRLVIRGLIIMGGLDIRS